ncbi:Uu.00g011760.m01.CDS01 [Anthostomella pinea]|uniref:Uu.00g011760.m01.CDS01 n=1 Tax=Anthostomella pinea TaxID=933095 RepID=A0AAI8VXU4_9PEZI|nr:Uu.00g011760.m01.CDS01 [Anthostomella pinea]
MQIAAFLLTLAAAATVTAAAVPGLDARDVCGTGYGGDQRRTNSPCEASNGASLFCGCDGTDVVQCTGGFWREIQDCGAASCSGGLYGGAACS